MKMLELKCQINGKIISEPKLIADFGLTKIYEIIIENKRTSGKIDKIVVDFNSDICKKLKVGDFIDVIGNVRSRRETINNYHITVIYISADNINILNSEPKDYRNEVKGKGVLNKEIVYRAKSYNTNLIIGDMILKLVRSHNRLSYIYCSIWNDNIDKSRDFKKGDVIDIIGRLQSHERNNILTSEVSIFKLRKADTEE